MRTYRYFRCANGHRGEEKTSENDQPYSAPWERVETTGLKERGQDTKGYTAYACAACGLPMAELEPR